MSLPEAFDFRNHIDILADQETARSWSPFPDHYVDTRIQEDVTIPQISLDNPKVHVICKITDDFATMQQYAFDEESLPPKVLCWNDVSALDIKTATKTVKLGLEREFHHIVNDLSISFQSVSVGNREHIPLGDSRPDLIIYHILDPTLSQKPRITPASIHHKRNIKLSASSPQLNRMSEYYSPQYVQTVQQPPIHDDPDGLRRLADEIQTPAVFIIDCSYASRALSLLSNVNKNFIVFAATSESLLYTPQLPCDLFTSCLLTPARIALLWQSQSYSDIRSGLLSDIDLQTLIDLLNDSTHTNQIIEMLETALAAYVDQMAFEVITEDTTEDPVAKARNQEMFYSIFRKNRLTAKLFSNFIFAIRVMRSVSILPISYPALPNMTNHPLWDSFDLQIDRALYSLKESMYPTPTNIFSLNDILKEHMTRLNSWLTFANVDRPAPEELPWLVPLLSSPAFFPQAIRFTSQFVEISKDSVCHFLNTKAFPLLPKLLNSGALNDPQTIAPFSFVVVNCLLASSQLKAYFEDKVEFWLEQVQAKDKQTKIASLCCLLIFADSPGKIDLYHEHNLQDLLETLVTNKSSSLRTLAHLILAKMGINISMPMSKIAGENAPLCRAALVSRVTTTMDSIEPTNTSRQELFFDLIISLNDPYPLVREESLIALSHTINSEGSQFLSSLFNYLNEWRDDKANNPLITLLGHELQILQFEPSKRISERLTEFLTFLSEKFNDNPTVTPLTSNLSRACLNKMSQSNTSSLAPISFSAESMIINQSDAHLIGSPAVSPSGLFACGDSKGIIHCQTTDSEKTVLKHYDYFVSGVDVNAFPHKFTNVTNIRNKIRPVTSYLTFIDDQKLLAVSDKSQVVIIDSNVPNDASTAFWMTPPDICHSVIVDYNYRAFQVLYSTGASLAHVYDLNTQKKLEDIRLPRMKTQNLQWMNAYSTLFGVTQEDFFLYDIRINQSVATLPKAGINLLNCNCSTAATFNLVMGYKNGKISMYDMRSMAEVSSRDFGWDIKQFAVHSSLPFGVGMSDSLISVSFETGFLVPEPQELSVVPTSFVIHQTESTCAVRSDGKVQCIVIDY